MVVRRQLRGDHREAIGGEVGEHQSTSIWPLDAGDSDGAACEASRHDAGTIAAPGTGRRLAWELKLCVHPPCRSVAPLIDVQRYVQTLMEVVEDDIESVGSLEGSFRGPVHTLSESDPAPPAVVDGATDVKADAGADMGLDPQRTRSEGEPPPPAGGGRLRRLSSVMNAGIHRSIGSVSIRSRASILRTGRRKSSSQPARPARRVRFASISHSPVESELTVARGPSMRPRVTPVPLRSLGSETVVQSEMIDGSGPNCDRLCEVVDSPAKLIGGKQLLPVRYLGAGTFGIVYQCRYDELERHANSALFHPPDGMVAVKTLRSDAQISMSDYHSLTAEEITEFADELLIVERLRHPHIIGYVGSGLYLDAEGHDQLAMVFEYASQGSLREMLLGGESFLRRPYTVTEGLRWCEEIAEGLAYLHGCDPMIVHRDLKPENVLLCGPERVAKLCDFGLAAVERRRENTRRVSARLEGVAEPGEASAAPSPPPGKRLARPRATSDHGDEVSAFRAPDEDGGEEAAGGSAAHSYDGLARAAAEFRMTGATGSLRYMVRAPTHWLARGWGGSTRSRARLARSRARVRSRPSPHAHAHSRVLLPLHAPVCSSACSRPPSALVSRAAWRRPLRTTEERRTRTQSTSTHSVSHARHPPR
jgi:serine/threonine protein kinase